MKKFLCLFLVLGTFLFTGCNMCGSPTVLQLYNPWGRNQVLEISTYRVSAQKPSDKELEGFGMPYYITGSGTYTSTVTKNGDGNLVVTNDFSFKGKYFTNTDSEHPILKKDGSGDGTFEDSYTATAVVDINTFEAISSKRDCTQSTGIGWYYADGSKTATYFLKTAKYTQTIAYGSTKATATVQNQQQPDVPDDEKFVMSCSGGKESLDYTYKDADLVFDNETFAAAMRAYSVHSAFAGGQATPSSFKLVSPLDSAAVKTMKFSAAAEKITVTSGEQDLYATWDGSDQSSLVTNPEERKIEEADSFKTTLNLDGKNPGTSKVLWILKDENVTFHKEASEGGGEASNPTPVNRIAKMTDGMNMVYELTDFVNASKKTAKTSD